MVVIMKPDAGDEDIRRVVEKIRSEGMDAHVSRGKETTIIGIIGDEREIDFASLGALPHVDRAMPILKPFKYVSRDVCPQDRVVRVGNVEIGKDLVFIAGPCSVEDEDTTLLIAEQVRQAGADVFRAGAYKPRTSPWSFQGLREKGLEILSKVRRETGLPICTEVIDTSDIDAVGEHTDIYQVGMRNMRNYALLTKLGKTDKPVLLKRGDSATLYEWLAAADYIVRNGNENVILCERGIRTFESYTRNTLDLNAVAGAKIESCLPVLVDPSHGTGRSDMVAPMSSASVAAGADGLMLEVHSEPQKAWSDAAQTITPRELKDIVEACRALRGLQHNVGQRENQK
ncbi:MAG: 3-deoxy-7-phosphoheptulonate synthase [Planctomycetaceae bacterium]|nr:3-deoxy-7-phosphoheptulonate synthase [Planctomycetaceae bacterium]